MPAAVVKHALPCAMFYAPFYRWPLLLPEMPAMPPCFAADLSY
jgi:hypothetical protein